MPRSQQYQAREEHSRPGKVSLFRRRDEYSSMDDNGLFGDPGFKQHSELMGKHRPAEIEALRLIALMSLKESQLFPGFHALGNHPKLHAPAHADDRRHDGRIVRSGGDLADKRLVDLQRIDRALS